MYYSQGKIGFSFVDDSNRALIQGNFEKSIRILESELQGIEVISSANKYDCFSEQEVAPDLCDACETCIEICQMDAITMTNGASEVNKKRCIGCGNCVAKCPSEALTLQKKEQEFIPPETEADLYNTIWDKKKVLLERERKRQLRKEKQT